MGANLRNPGTDGTFPAGSGESTPTFSVDVHNHITGYTYDAAGNLTSDGNNGYLFDAENRMSPNSGGAVVYTYDGDGHRVKTLVAGTTTLNWYDDSFQPVSVGDGTGAVARDYVFFGGKRIGFTSLSTGNTHYYLTDHLGSPREIVNGDGTSVEWEADYYPFGGKRVLNNGLDTFFLFTGWEIDYELTFGIDYYYNAGFREQSTWIGRFLSPDPAGLAAVDASNPQSWNLYAYALNNPMKYVDPLGLDCAYFDDAGYVIEEVDQFSNAGECGGNGGYWVDGGITGFGFNDNGSLWLTGTTNGTDVTNAWYPGNSNQGSTWTSFVPSNYFNWYYGQLQQTYNNQNTAVPTSQQYVQAIANAAPTVCGGGVFAYGGPAVKDKFDAAEAGAQGFYEWDSHTGFSKGIVVEGQVGPLGGGVAKQKGQPLDPFVFVGQAAGMIAFKSGAVGVYAGSSSGGVGAYGYVTTNAGCKKHP